MRGSIPTPGPDTVRYGGNTSCVEVRCGSEVIILDAGSGLRKLGQALLAEFPQQPLNLSLLLTHTHWDHIQGLPYFGPAYESRCRLRIFCCEGARRSLLNALTSQMESTYFPVPFTKLPSNIEIEEIVDGQGFMAVHFAIGPVLVRAQRANHPGLAVGYRLFTPDGLIVFFPDAEPRATADSMEMVEFIRDADVLILDSQYDVAGYRQHVGWGHGCVDDSVALALRANVKKLLFFHHDPDSSDETIDAYVRHGRKLAAAAGGALAVDAAREGMVVQLGQK